MTHNAEKDVPKCSCVSDGPLVHALDCTESDVCELWLCEAQDGVFLRPDTLYRFEVKDGCDRCEELGARYGHRPIPPAKPEGDS